MPTLSKNPNSSARLLADSVEAERRLREAEERLREAIEELQRRMATTRRATTLKTPAWPTPLAIFAKAFSFLMQLVSEKDLIVREEACRIGLLFGGFTGSYHALRCLLRKLRKKETPVNAILAGSIAGLSILALDDSNRRRTLALHLLARVAQCAYNSAKSKNKFHFWGSHWRHGDSLLFAFACAQVMYVFVMCPESLPKSYQDFIQKTGPVAVPVYKAVRENCRGGPVNVASILAYLYRQGKSNNVKLEEFPSIIPCSVIHPDTSSCLAHNAKAASATFRKTFPLYFSLTFVPFVVLHLQKFMDTPARTCWLAVKGAVRSTSFLSAFVGIFQVALFCACMGGIMYYLEYEPDTMASFLRGLIRRFLASRISNPGPSSNRTASYTCLQTLDDIQKPKLQDSGEVETSTSKQYNLESIPGL
ncbi:hypothetical protein CRYUN_Cryun07bG0010900 [Craigia yunnanensis]